MNALKLAARVLAVLAFSPNLFAADVPKLPVPKSPYLPVVYRFADTMLEKGRDTYGPLKTGMFLSALNRETLAPLTNRPKAPEGVGEEERVGAKTGPLTGSNPQHDENLLRLLYLLSDLSSKPKYREAADASLKSFLENTASSTTRLLPWGTRLSWNVMTDEPNAIETSVVHEFFRPWMLWDRCFEVAPNPSREFARALWQFDIANPERASIPDLPLPKMKAPREVGFSIRTWAVAYAHTQDPRFLKPIESLLNRFARTAIYWQAPQSSKLSMAIDCDGAARLVPEPLASNLQHFAEAFKAEDRDAAPAPLWNARPVTTTAQVGLMCLSRYDNTGHVDYRKLLIDAAHAYLKSLPANDEDVWPGTFGQAISLQVGAWRHTADPNYLDRARQLADLAVEKFWGTNALPRASYKSDHYESITGADTLALALVELHLNILHITAVRCPPNTIDR